MATTCDVLVIGGGAVGAASAWWAARAGLEVVLLEQHDALHDRGGSHGSARIFRLAYAEADYLALGLEALPLWRLLEGESGTTLLTTTGGIDHGSATEVEAIAANLGDRATWLAPEEAAERWRGMAFDGRVLHQPDAGRIDADATVAALHREAARHGADLRFSTPVEHLDTSRARPVVATPDGTVEAAAVIVAAGSWTPTLLADQVAVPPLRVTDEQPAHFAPQVPAEGWPIFVHYQDVPDGRAIGHYGLLDPALGVKVGEHGTGPVVDPSARGGRAPRTDELERLTSWVQRWLPGVDPHPRDPVSCLYDSTDDEDFVLDRSGPVTIGCGFSGHGFKFVPALGRELVRLAQGGDQPIARFGL